MVLVVFEKGWGDLVALVTDGGVWIDEGNVSEADHGLPNAWLK